MAVRITFLSSAHDNATLFTVSGRHYAYDL